MDPHHNNQRKEPKQDGKWVREKMSLKKRNEMVISPVGEQEGNGPLDLRAIGQCKNTFTSQKLPKFSHNFPRIQIHIQPSSP